LGITSFHQGKLAEKPFHFRMVLRVLGLRSKNDQILRAVVSFVAITMVNCLIFSKRATQHLFGNDPVLMNAKHLRVCLALTGVQVCPPELFSGFRGHSVWV